MSNVNLAFLLLAGVSAAAAIAALISKELGTRPKAAIVTFLSVVTIFAFVVALPGNPPAPPDVEPSPTAPITTGTDPGLPVDTPAVGPTSTAYTGAIDPPVIDCFELLTTPWVMNGAANGDAGPENFQSIDGLLQDSEVLQILIDIHGASFEEGQLKDESAIIIDQPDGQWTVASVATHGLENGKDGDQAVYIPLSDFIGITPDGATRGALDLTQPYGPLHARFWNETDFTVEISSIMACRYQRV
jgi:hypothetical protein